MNGLCIISDFSHSFGVCTSTDYRPLLATCTLAYCGLASLSVADTRMTDVPGAEFSATLPEYRPFSLSPTNMGISSFSSMSCTVMRVSLCSEFVARF